MGILVIAPGYPSAANRSELMYVHVRNRYYKEQGIDVTVLNFKAKDDYIIDGINVISLKSFRANYKVKYDCLICHAPNLRNHYIFLKKYESRFRHIVFFFHGHEIVRINDVYPNPYSYLRSNSKLITVGQDIYDTLKLKLWKDYYLKLRDKSTFIFVSNLLYRDFIKFMKINPEIISNKTQIIHNGVGKIFEEKTYNINKPKKYDFITVRSNIDASEYCIDLIIELAKKNSEYSFLIIGKGKYFIHNDLPLNVTFIEKLLSHEELLSYIDNSRYALMPTRRDSQGVMACELATFGIPLITSDIDICHEIFWEFKNVVYIKNDITNINLERVIDSLNDYRLVNKNKKYMKSNTIHKEVNLLKNIIKIM